jgi:hypothetical protein
MFIHKRNQLSKMGDTSNPIVASHQRARKVNNMRSIADNVHGYGALLVPLTGQTAFQSGISDNGPACLECCGHVSILSVHLMYPH